MAARPRRAEDGREGRRTAGPAGTATMEVGTTDGRRVLAQGVAVSAGLTGRDPVAGTRKPGPRRSESAQPIAGAESRRIHHAGPAAHAGRTPAWVRAPRAIRARRRLRSPVHPHPFPLRLPPAHAPVHPSTRRPIHPTDRPPGRVAGARGDQRSVVPDLAGGMTTEYANAERGNSEEHGDAPGRAGREGPSFPAVPLRHAPVPPGLGQMTPRRPNRAAWKPVVRVQGGAMTRQIRIRTSRRTTSGREVKMEIDRRTPSGRILPY